MVTLHFEIICFWVFNDPACGYLTTILWTLQSPAKAELIWFVSSVCLFQRGCFSFNFRALKYFLLKTKKSHYSFLKTILWGVSYSTPSEMLTLPSSEHSADRRCGLINGCHQEGRRWQENAHSFPMPISTNTAMHLGCLGLGSYRPGLPVGHELKFLQTRQSVWSTHLFEQKHRYCSGRMKGQSAKLAETLLRAGNSVYLPARTAN